MFNLPETIEITPTPTPPRQGKGLGAAESVSTSYGISGGVSLTSYSGSPEQLDIECSLPSCDPSEGMCIGKRHVCDLSDPACLQKHLENECALEAALDFLKE